MQSGVLNQRSTEEKGDQARMVRIYAFKLSICRLRFPALRTQKTSLVASLSALKSPHSFHSQPYRCIATIIFLFSLQRSLRCFAFARRQSSFIGAIVIGDLVKTTLGPRGMDKILQSPTSGEIQVTNDGATILGAVHIDNPAAKVLVDISKTQDNEVGDGTTSVCVLAAELLREAEKLVNAHIHPQTIIAGASRHNTNATLQLTAARLQAGAWRWKRHAKRCWRRRST